MARRIKKQIPAAAFAGMVIIAAVALWRHFHESGLSPADPNQPASREALRETSNKPQDQEEVLAERPKSVLQSTLAGSWYPADPQILKKQLKGFFDSAEVSPRNDVIALILPHAGYSYSGKTACAGLKTITRHYERIIVIGPSHSARMENVFIVPRVTHYETPLGQIPLDVEFIEKLMQHPVFQNVPHAHQREHSVQIEVPLLQFADSGFKLVPIVAGSCSLETVKRAAAILASMVDEKTLVVASSDFVHYGASY